MSYRKARTKHDKIKLMTYIQYIQYSWTVKKEKNKIIIVCQLHNNVFQAVSRRRLTSDTHFKFQSSP